MHGRPRIAVAELFLFTLIKRNDQSLSDYDLKECVMIRRYCLSLSKVDHWAYMAGATKLNSRVRLSFVSNKKLFQALVTWIGKDKFRTPMSASITLRTSTSTMARSSSTRTSLTMPTRTTVQRRSSFRSLSYFTKSILMDALCLTRSVSWSNPSTKHSSNFVDYFLQC